MATIAPYNAAFGARFDKLFASATDEIKDFARRLEELGGSILSTVDGVEVTVEHVAALNEADLAEGRLRCRLDKFRRCREAEEGIGAQAAHPTCVVQPPGVGHGQERRRRRARAGTRSSLFPAAITTQALSIEEAKLRRVEESIRIFVRVADPKFRQIVPMRYFNLMLSPAEVEAYTADYLEEASSARGRWPACSCALCP